MAGLLASPLPGQSIITWSGASDDDNWSNVENWVEDVVPVIEDTARFDDVPEAGAVAVNLDAIQSVRGLIFDSTSRNYAIGTTSGSHLSLNGDAADSAISVVGNHQINVPVLLETNVVVTTTGAADSLTIGGQIASVFLGPATGLSKEGSGTLILQGGNTYTGATSVSGGTLLITSGFINNTSGVNVTGNSSVFRYNSGTGLGRIVSVTDGGTFAYNSSTNYSGTLTLTNGTLEGTNWNGNLGGLTVGANQTISPGNSVGHASTTTQTWAGGGAYRWEINDADGTAGQTSSGWDLLTLSGDLTLTATEGNPVTIQVLSLGLNNQPGLAVNFNSLQNYNWLIAEAGSMIAEFSSSLFAIDVSGFSNFIDPLGFFSVVRGDSILGGTASQLYLSYNVIPEPGAVLLIGIGLLAIAVTRHRRVL